MSRKTKSNTLLLSVNNLLKNKKKGEITGVPMLR